MCIRDSSDIVRPQHSIKLNTGQFLVSYRGTDLYRGFRNVCIHRVSLVGDNGKVTRSYGYAGGSDVGEMNMPRHLAVDKDSHCVFVADRDNARVVLLSPTLEFVRYVIEGLTDARRLYFNQATRRLFVGQGDTRPVTVIQL